MLQIGNDWDELLAEESEKEYFKKLEDFIEKERAEHTVYPPGEDVFNALKYTSLADTKVVILGQDPYHEPGQAHGLAFSVPKSEKLPPSLRNILKELSEDVGLSGSYGKPQAEYEPMPGDEGHLVSWARQGVLLLNTVLTVRAHEAASHQGRGWEEFTDAVIRRVASNGRPVVFLLWGAPAGRKKELILRAAADQAAKPLVITAPHPSPLSAHRGFFGGRYFSRANFHLRDCGLAPIDWSLEQ